MKALITSVLVVALTSTAAVAQGTINGTLGTNTISTDTNNISGDNVAGDVNNNDIVNHNNNSTTNTSNNTTNHNNSTSVQNGYGGPSNGYVTSTPVSPGQNTCVYGHGEAFSAAGIGISSGKVFIDEGCQKIRDESHRLNQLRQNVTLMANIGLKDAAVSMMCQDYSMRQSLRLSLPKATYDKLCKKFER